MKEYILDIKDFSLTRKLLEKNNIPIIPSHSKKQHSEILTNFFRINNKNRVQNINLIFSDTKIEKKFYTTFPIMKFLDIQNDDDNKTVKVLLDYTKEQKYYDAMIMPLKEVIVNKYSPYIHCNNNRYKMELSVYKYLSINHELEIIQTEQWSKNMVYGLLHYINLDKNLFASKHLVLQSLKTVTIEKKNFMQIDNFLNKMKLDEFKYELDIVHEYNADTKVINLSFYHNDDEEFKNEILKFNDFNIEFLVNLFCNIYNLEQILNELYIQKNVILLKYSQDNIGIVIGNEYVKFEKDNNFISNVLKDIILNKKKTLTFISYIKLLFKNTRYIEELVSKDDYYRSEKNKYILYEISELMK